MAEQNDNTAAMAVDIKYIKENISEIKETLKSIQDGFVKKEEFEKFTDHYDGLHQQHTSDIQTLQLEQNTLATTWKVWGIIAGIVFGIIEPVIVAYLLSKGL